MSIFQSSLKHWEKYRYVFYMEAQFKFFNVYTLHKTNSLTIHFQINNFFKVRNKFSIFKVKNCFDLKKNDTNVLVSSL